MLNTIYMYDDTKKIPIKCMCEFKTSVDKS